MTANILNGKELATSIKNELKQKISCLDKKPNLAVIMVGNNSASEVYVRNKEKSCLDVGITTSTYKLPENTTKEELLNLIEKLNLSADVNGILVQLPLPSHLNADEILNSISPLKDVDGFHPLNTGLIIKKQKAFTPCTPKGIIELLHLIKKDLTGFNAVVVGRSQIVGLPIAHLLINENCTVTVTHSKTKNLASICKTADILIAAIGKPEFITKEYIKENSIIIDVGINRTKDGLKGDVKFSDALDICSYITPVPGGVGPMTIAMLLKNTYDAYLNQNNS